MLLQQADLRHPATSHKTAAAIADLLADLTLPTALTEALAVALPSLATDTTPLAIRSSAIGEDGATVSYAGQYATSLGIIGPDAVKAAILTGWRSFFSAIALAARASPHELANGEGMALLIAHPTRSHLALIAPYLAADAIAPAFSRAEARKAREAEIKTLCMACPDPAIVTEFRRQLAYARKVSAVVEQHNHYLDQMYTSQVRQAVVAAGRWLVDGGVLANVDEIFWLHFAEISELLRTPAVLDVAALIAPRQAEHKYWQTLETPPILGMPAADLPERPAWHDEVLGTTANMENQPVSILKGIGASHGRHRGRARISTNAIKLPDLKSGDILVAINVGPHVDATLSDSGWSRAGEGLGGSTCRRHRP